MLWTVTLLLLAPTIMFARWGVIENDPECYVLAGIYGAGAVFGSAFLFLFEHHYL